MAHVSRVFTKARRSDLAQDLVGALALVAMLYVGLMVPAFT